MIEQTLYIVSVHEYVACTDLQVNNFTKQVHLISVLYHIVVGARVGGENIGQAGPSLVPRPKCT